MNDFRLSAPACWCGFLCAAGLVLSAVAQEPGPLPPVPQPPPASPQLQLGQPPAQPSPPLPAQPPAPVSSASGRVYIPLPSPPPDFYDWTRHFRIGLLAGLNIKASFSVNANNMNIAGVDAGVFNDGYVRPSGNAFGTTSDWGYDSASQYNAAAQTLTFRQTTSFSASGNGDGEDSPYLGFDLAYGDTFKDWGRTRLGWEFGFALLPISIGDNRPLSASVNGNVLQFNTGGIDLGSPPPDSYQGSPGSGPAISSSGTVVSTFADPNGTVTGTRNLNVMLYTLRLGPTLYWDVHRRVGVSLGGGPAVGIVSGDLKFDEEITTAEGTIPNRGKINGTEIVYGGYVSAAVMYHAVEGGDIYLGVQFTPLSDARFSGQGHEARLDLSGQVYISAGINWPF